ncbi:hypothetical protein QYF36_023521 [Acer negundo]|nr:hypothetical protein QYF36_023521 [Acer negundo]
MSNIFLATRNDLALSEDVAVPYSLVSNALVVSSDPVASSIFSDSVSLTASREQQSGNVIPAIDSLVQTVSTTVGLSSLQRPLIRYTAHRVRKD